MKRFMGDFLRNGIICMYRNVPSMFMACDRKSLLVMARWLRMYEDKTKAIFTFYTTFVLIDSHIQKNRHCVMLKSLYASEYYLIPTIIIGCDRATHPICARFMCFHVAVGAGIFFFSSEQQPSNVTCTLVRTRTIQHNICMYRYERTHSFKIHSSQFSRWTHSLFFFNISTKKLPQWLLPTPSEFNWVFRIIYYNNFTGFDSILFFVHHFLTFDCHIRPIKRH